MNIHLTPFWLFDQLLTLNNNVLLVYLSRLWSRDIPTVSEKHQSYQTWSAGLQQTEGKTVRYIWASSWDYGTYHIGNQRRLRRAYASGQSSQSFRCSHTWSMEVDKTVRPKIRHLAPLDGCACAFEEWVTEDEKYRNLVTWLRIFFSVSTAAYLYKYNSMW